jgi:riboflavin synthase alpha subunit
LGDSICVSGVCLTVSAIEGNIASFDVIAETLDKSTLGSRNDGDHVNLERSLAWGDRFHGHFVQGHVDGVAKLQNVTATAKEHLLSFQVGPALVPFLIPKGSVALDGVSLTIAALHRNGFSVALIPTTLERTTLSELKVGLGVNVETDVIVRTIIHRMDACGGNAGITLETLQQAGFA